MVIKTASGYITVDVLDNWRQSGTYWILMNRIDNVGVFHHS